MNTITNGNGYPIFAPNQVLKFTDLNSLVNYLDQQNRLTRTHLIGMGILCGLELKSNYQIGQAQILISEGCGVTSEGFLIAVSNSILTHYQPEQPVTVAMFNPTDITEPTSPPPQVKVTELFSQAGSNRIPLDQTLNGNQRDESAFRSFLANQVLVVAWEMQEAQRDSCLVDCDDRGKDRSFRPRFFLLPQLQTQETSIADLSAETLLRKGYEIDRLGATWSSLPTQELFEARYNFLKNFDPKVRRFGHALEQNDQNQLIDIVRLTNIADYKTFVQNYYKVCAQAINEIGESFPQLFCLFSPFFSPLQPPNTDFNSLRNLLINRLNAIVPASMRPSTSLVSAPIEREDVEQVEAQYALQYFYDYLSQLVAAYGELVEIAFDLMADCPPETQRFPKFLLLGLVPSPNTVNEVCTIPSAYRSHFTQPPLYNGNDQRLKQVRHLYDRLVRLCNTDSFYLLPFYDTPLKITPSKDRSVSLSEQAIPYYLNYPNLYRYWSYDDCRKGISDRHPAYFYPTQSNNPFIPNRDLICRLDQASFYRIEGHIGEGSSVALQRVRDYQQRYNLPFDVIVLKLGEKIAGFNDLTLSGQFDDLEADFGRMKDKFQKLWLKYQPTWESNVFLQTLKRIFFDQTSLTAISYTQLFNPVLALAAQPEAYDFISVSDHRYHLQLRNAAGTHIARFVTLTEGASIDLVIDFSGLSAEAIASEQARIKKALIACLSLGKVTYGVEPQAPNNQVSYHVRFSVEDNLDLAIAPAISSPRATVAIHLQTLNYFSVNFFSIAQSSGQPQITQSEFQDFESLYGLLRDIPEEYARELELPFGMGDRQAADCLNYFEFKGLMEAYQHRLEKLMELHLFHKFAQYHSGMEHLGGVPKGGTFILVYVDGADLVNPLLTADLNPQYQSRTPAIQRLVQFPADSAQERKISRELLNREDIVVADFCLPYRCCSNAPVVNYLLAQPRPIVLLEKTVFCEDDETRYEFILDPAEGILKGEGVLFVDGKYYFQPSLIEQNIGREVAITFTYVVEGSYDTLTVTIYPEPEASLSIADNFCADAKPVPITLNPNHPRIEIIQLSINGTNSSILNPVFDPQLYAQSQPQTVAIVAQIRDRLTQCTNEISRTITIYPLPDTGFSLDPEPTEGGYCAGKNDESVRVVVLQPNQSNVSERFTVNDQDLPSRRINLNQYAKIKEPVNLVLVHYAKGAGNCTAQSAQTITIFPLPDASFQLAANSVCANSKPVEITPTQIGGGFQALDENGNSIENAIALLPTRFIPEAVPLGDATRVTVQIVHTLVGKGGCTDQSEQEITVYKVPVGNFDVAIESFNPEQLIVQVSKIKPEGKVPYDFIWNFGDGEPSIEKPRNQDFTVQYNYNQFKAGDTVKISLTLNNSGCTSSPIAKETPVPFGVRELDLVTVSGDGENRIILANNAVFQISRFSDKFKYEIEARTLPQVLGSVVFIYTPPNAQEEKRPPTNSPPYRMIGGWKPSLGKHRIKAQAFSESNGNGSQSEILSISFTIVDSDTRKTPLTLKNVEP